jgi:hypothetical protein
MQAVRKAFQYNSVFFAAIFSTALVGEFMFDGAMDALWDRMNRGVPSLLTC